MSAKKLISIAGAAAVGVALAFTVPGLPARSESPSPSPSPTSEESTTPPAPQPDPTEPASEPSETTGPASPQPASPEPSESADPEPTSPSPTSPSPTSPSPTSPSPTSPSPSAPGSESPESPTASPTGPAPGDAPPAGKPQPDRDNRRGAGPVADPSADLYPQPPFTPVDGNRSAALLQRLYDAQTKQRSLRNQIAVSTAELADAQDAVAAAKSALRGARVGRDRAGRGLQDSVLTIYKSGAPYSLYRALESPSMLRDGAHGQLSALADASDRVDLLADDLAAAVDGRDALLVTLTDLRRSLSQADDAVTGIQRQTAKNLSDAAVPDSGTPAGVVSTGKLLWPVRGTTTSGYGNRFDPYYQRWQLHAGIDIAAPTGTAVLAASAGRVTQAGWNGGYGNYICLAHGQVRGQPMTTCYAHLSRIHVTDGQTVTRGQRIGDVGSTGASTGPHLHFEVRFGGRPADPRLWL